MLKLPKVSMKGTRRATWLDLFYMSKVDGEELFYLVEDEWSGEWLFKVRVPKDEKKITINVIESSMADFVCDQIKKRTIMFIRSEDSDLYYHPLSLAYVENDKLYFRRLRNVKKVPDYIIHHFQIAIYKELGPKKKSGFGVVAIIPKGLYEKMVELFVLENIWPIFSSFAFIKKEETGDMNLLEQFLRDQGLIIIGKYENELEVWNGADLARVSPNGKVITCSTRHGKKDYERMLRLYILWRKFKSTKSM